MGKTERIHEIVKKMRETCQICRRHETDHDFAITVEQEVAKAMQAIQEIKALSKGDWVLEEVLAAACYM